MQQLIENLKNGEVRLVETPAPGCGAGEILVRNAASLISPGTEKLLIQMGQKSIVGKAMARPDLVSLALQKARKEGFLNVFREALDRLDEPLPLGYSSAGEVVRVGRDVRGFSPGDRVACAGAGVASHADLIAVPQELCVKLSPPKPGIEPLSMEEASFVMLGGIALQGFRAAGLSFGERFVVVGLGLIGLLTVQIGKAYGCAVAGLDIDPEKVERARSLGCDLGLVSGRDQVEQAVSDFTNGEGADAVILAAATKDNAPVLLAERIARKRGGIILVGVSELLLTRKAFWDKELFFAVSRASGPAAPGGTALPHELVRWSESRNLREFVRLMETGAVKTRELITHRVPVEKATGAYDMILKGTEKSIGVVITYAGADPDARTVALPAGGSVRGAGAPAGNRSRVGVIGAGLFTKNVLLPTAAKVPGLVFGGIAARTGVSARHVGNKFSFAYATTDVQALLDDRTAGSVLITTRHNLHAGLITAALGCGKHVFVEKPLCITRPQLDEVLASFARAEGSCVLMVGFNRRYSPLGMRMRDFFGSRTAPMQIAYRVNAGFLPPDHWTLDPQVGGGRIVGEGCHFIDFMQFLTGEDPVWVSGGSLAGETGSFQPHDNVSLTIGFSGGSLGTLAYTALGSKAFSRERVEAFADGSAAVTEDFRTLSLVRGSKRKNERLWNQDMGFGRELEHFLTVPPPDAGAMVRSAALTTLATFAAETALRTGERVRVEGGAAAG
ncbi:MAG: bi-domain-containing oxidoreductase [Bacteroidota bacterium]